MFRLNEARSEKSAAKRRKLKQRREKVKEMKQRGTEMNNFSNDGSFLSQFLNEAEHPELATTGGEGATADSSNSSSSKIKSEKLSRPPATQTKSDKIVEASKQRVVERVSESLSKEEAKIEEPSKKQKHSIIRVIDEES